MTINTNAANITSIRLAEQSSNPSTPASGFAQLFVDTNGDLATRKDAGGIKIATSPASGDYIFTIDGTGTAARLNASNVFTSAQVLPAGTVGAPALTTTGDTNTGVYFPGADRIGFATGGVIRGSWTTDGLCFGSDTAAANALDDYEEGDILSSSLTLAYETAGTSSFTYSNRSGIYVKIGRTVFFSIDIRLSAFTKGTASGNLNIVGLPFAARTTSGFTEHFCVVALHNWTLTSAIAPIAFVLGATTKIQISKMVSNAGFAVIDDPGASSLIFVTGYYFV
jgi:hypothetical protein